MQPRLSFLQCLLMGIIDSFILILHIVPNRICLNYLAKLQRRKQQHGKIKGSSDKCGGHGSAPLGYI